MKRINLYLTALLLATCAGCTNSLPDNNETTSSNLELISVGLKETEQTKGIVTAIDEVIVYVAKQDQQIPYNAATPSLVFTQDNTGKWSSTSAIEITNDGGAADVYACYPTVTAVSTENGLSIPVSVIKGESTDNTQLLDFTGSQQTDYLYATKISGVTPTSRSISLTMNHALAKVSFVINKATDVSEQVVLKKVKILSKTNKLQTGDGGSMQLTDGTLNGLVTTESVTLSGSIILTASLKSPNVYTLVAPMSAAESSLSFNLVVTIDGESEERSFLTGSVPVAVQWKAGQHYIYHITVNKIGGVLTGFKILDWRNDSSQDTNIGI
ncbi:fimbrillin family protein [Parabacteroides sp.]